MPRRPSTHVDDPAAVGRRLREARERAGISQRRLAFEGCTPAYISRVEAGYRIPSLQILRELAARLGTTADWLATGSREDETVAALDEADAAARLGELEHAAEAYERVLGDDPSPEQASRARMGLAEVAHRRGDPRRVVEILEPLLAESRDELDSEAAAWTADRLGRAYAHLGEFESSLAVLGRGLDRARSEGSEGAVLRLSTLLANALLDRGSVGRAEQLLSESIQLADGVDDPVQLARVWWSQARLHIQQNRPEVAAGHIRRTIALLDAREHADFAAGAFQMLARIENERGNHAEALDLIGRGEPAGTAGGNRYLHALFEVERARALAGLGEPERAASVAMEAAALFEETNPVGAGRSYAVIAGVFRDLGDTARAREIYELAAERLGEADPFQAEIHAALGELLEAEGRADEAMRAYKRAAQARARTATG